MKTFFIPIAQSYYEELVRILVAKQSGRLEWFWVVGICENDVFAER